MGVVMVEKWGWVLGPIHIVKVLNNSYFWKENASLHGKAYDYQRLANCKIVQQLFI